MSNGRYCYRVTVHDNSRLGGPMGTETTKVIKSRVHETHRLAMAWAKEQQNTYCGHSHRYSAIAGSGLTDLGTIGIEVQRERIHG